MWPTTMDSTVVVVGESDKRRKRVLLVHPYASSGPVFAKKADGLLKLLGWRGDVVAPNAPHAYVEAGADKMDGATEAKDGRFCWFRFGDAEPPIDAPLEAFLRAGAAHLHGIEESIACLRDAVARQECEGWICFSQGAAFVSILLASLKEDDVLWKGIRWMVLASHFDLPNYSIVDGSMLRSPRMFPTLHLAGSADVYVPLEWTQRSFEQHFKGGSSRALFLAHDGKHHLPSKGVYRKPTNDWFNSL